MGDRCSGYMKECLAKAEHEDPRDPPETLGVALCSVCFRSAATERVEELEVDIAELKKEAGLD